MIVPGVEYVTSLETTAGNDFQKGSSWVKHRQKKHRSETGSEVY